MRTAEVSEIATIPTQRALDAPGARCLSDDSRALNNAEFDATVRRTATMLHSRGIASGDTVAVLLPNGIELVATLFAAWRLGAALTPVNPALTDDEVLYQLQDSTSAVLVGDARGQRLARAAETQFLAASDIFGAETVPLAELPEHCPRPDDFGLIVYTGGTTGRPKGVLLDHTNLAAMSAALVQALGLGRDDVSLLVLPLFHLNGLVVTVLSTLRAGGSVVIAPRFRADAFWDLVETHRPTFFSAVPTVYAILEATTRRAVDASSLRFAACGAAPMPADLIGRFEARFGVPIVEGYGLTEGATASTLNPLDGPRKPGTVGVALPGQQVAIMAPDDRILPPGAPGEVVIRGANVMRGYLGRPDVTAAVVRDGWLHTGDVGYLDADGYLVLVDRLKDLISSGEENIYPKEVEETLYQHPAVLEAAVVGRPDSQYGEVPVAFVALRPDCAATATQLREHCAATLATFKVPREIRLLHELPKNSVGKLVKGPLRVRLAEAATPLG